MGCRSIWKMRVGNAFLKYFLERPTGLIVPVITLNQAHLCVVYGSGTFPVPTNVMGPAFVTGKHCSYSGIRTSAPSIPRISS